MHLPTGPTKGLRTPLLPGQKGDHDGSLSMRSSVFSAMQGVVYWGNDSIQNKSRIGEDYCGCGSLSGRTILVPGTRAGLNCLSQSLIAKPAPKPVDSMMGHCRRLKSKTEATTPTLKPMPTLTIVSAKHRSNCLPTTFSLPTRDVDEDIGEGMRCRLDRNTGRGRGYVEVCLRCRPFPFLSAVGPGQD